MLRSLLGIWTWFAFGLVSIIGYFQTLLVLLFIFPFDKNRKWTGRQIRFWGRCMAGCVPTWKFRCLEPLPQKLPERTVCVSNHCSNIDPFLLGHLPWEMKFLAKSILFKIPCVGWGMVLAQDIPLVRGSHQSVKVAMRKCAEYVRNGMPVLIFPEGTRSTNGELLPFKDGAFRLAIEEQADVLPIAVGGTVGALKRGDWRPGKAEGLVAVGEPIPTRGLTMKDLNGLKEKVRAAIEEQRARFPQGSLE
ncbi:MAG: 1-acyl-sn-glycerol-3-phosphate acyltransferase [Polyangiaceae bacterium]|nr:1-acyl-sn-glycerol-3-phosphate acyltransferase [Polyangiaceae bacterium]